MSNENCNGSHPWMAKKFVKLREAGYSPIEAAVIMCGNEENHKEEVERLARFFGIVRFQRKNKCKTLGEQ